MMLDNELTFPILTIDSDQKIVVENLSLDIKCEYDCSNIGKLTIDNEKMKILSDGKLIPYSLIGWKDDNINWLKLKSGNNKLKSQANVFSQLNMNISGRQVVFK